MPPRGVKSAKRTRQYEHIKESELQEGRSTARAKQIAAATVNKQRAQTGEASPSGGRKKAAGRKKASSAGRKKASSTGRRKTSSASRTAGSRTTAARKSSSRKRR
jgi:hypothetical protein